ncbi:hypothetical protein QJS10_CPB20g00620 [Acorus calamus]|uniref:Uncharacterized protein n=1 Tax=Acorus calamus TaxID=4465 RepID=A0AAV9C994_ACOCL|nr:hypothetical protein QJS10_CPB20g00620 [Acorus calamus]
MDELRFVWSVEFWRMGLYWTLSLLYSYFGLLIKNFEWPSSSSSCSAYVRRSLESMPTKPVCVITGASSGLGAETASALAREGYYVILAGRSLDSLSKTIQEIKKKNEDAQLTAFEVDMSSILSIMKFANSLQKWFMDSTLHPSIQLLVNNAGILATLHRSTVDGYDEAADPGVVETNIMREVPPRLSRLAFTVLRFLCLLKSPKDGVESIIDAALAPPEASGEYFFGGKGRTIKSSLLSFDVGLAEALWVGSTKLFRETQLKLQVSMDA